MCGIAGRFNYASGRPVDESVIGEMCRLIAHRGPDGQGTWTDGPIGLGHRRLSIIDLTDAGRQPMSTAEQDLWITFNGEIYNFLDLRAELESHGHRFHSRTDTEVILAAYRQWGVKCLGRLRGMFALALWDARERRLFIARDRAGKKPLHYLLDRDGLAFASEPKAFLADPAFDPRPNRAALSAYLTYQYVPSPLSAFEGVRKLPPAHYLVVERGQVRVERYWKLSFVAKRRISEADARAELIDRLREAVRLRLISDVPLGAFLSGGVDSSAVVATMAQLTDIPVKTFSIGFEDKEFDELPYARAVAQRYRTDHHEFVVRPSASDILPELVWHYNEPFADSSAIPTYYLSALARRHVTVALNGDGGDENFAGYRRYVTPRSAQHFDRLPDPVRRAITAAASALPEATTSRSLASRGRRWVRRLAEPPRHRYGRRMMIFDPEMKAAVCSPEFLDETGDTNALSFLHGAFDNADALDPVDALLGADITYYLPDCLLVKVDIATMAHGLEGRSPLLDHEFMEFAASLPADLKLRGTETKYVFKQAVRDLLPDDSIDRAKKGFSVPMERWLRTELRDLTADLLLDGRLAARGYFRPEIVRHLVEQHWRGEGRWQNQLWSLLMLESWHRTFIDERPSGAPARPDQIAVEI
jgi:asparagine synthase (glutamine-hydrolysing)